VCGWFGGFFGLGMMNEVEFATFHLDVLMKQGVGFCGDEKRGWVR